MIAKTAKEITALVQAEQVMGMGHSKKRNRSNVTDERARAQRAKRDQQQQEAGAERQGSTRTKEGRSEIQARRRNIETLIESYIQDHIGGNHSDKTIEWHRISLGLMRIYFKEELDIVQIDGVEANDISAWFAHMRVAPGHQGKIRSERTIQTYARLARAFFHWLVRRGTLEKHPFDCVVFPKVGRPLIQTITDEELEKLLFACAPPNETGAFAERATVRNRAILWILCDTGIRVSELTNLSVDDLDRKKGVITVLGKGSKERRIALGQNCLRNVVYYLDKHRPDEEELAEWGSAGEDHLFLSETHQPLTKNGMNMLFGSVVQWNRKVV